MTTENKIEFKDLGVMTKVVEALKEEGIYNPTTIQEKAIPLAHAGHDIIGISRTGSGKTASFGIPVLETVEKGKGVQALVLAPTRELANQISKEMQKWGKYLNLRFATVFGGVSMEPQERAMKVAEIIVATPGRILDHLQRGNVRLDNLKVFVLDEADKMVEMGFIQDVEKILSASNDSRQIFLFGATISNEIDYLRKNYMHDVVVAEAELHVKKDLLKQYYYNVRTNEKFSLLVHLLKKEETGRVIIFCSKRSTVELVEKNLRKNGIKAEMIHGKMSQNKRLHVIERFNSDKTDILVASSVAARGLDIRSVTHVFNYDLSQDSQEYVHRVGRTARAGEEGVAITLLSEQDFGTFGQVLDRYDMDVEELPLEAFEKVRFDTGPRRDGRFGNRSGGRYGHRRGQGGHRGSAGRREHGRNRSRYSSGSDRGPSRGPSRNRSSGGSSSRR